MSLEGGVGAMVYQCNFPGGVATVGDRDLCGGSSDEGTFCATGLVMEGAPHRYANRGGWGGIVRAL